MLHAQHAAQQGLCVVYKSNKRENHEPLSEAVMCTEKRCQEDMGIAKPRFPGASTYKTKEQWIYIHIYIRKAGQGKTETEITK
jgi:hypothetical protein